MDSLNSYGKIYALGHRALEHLLDDPVVVEEKIDGSQFSFGLFPDHPLGPLLVRSHNATFPIDAPPKMFAEACDTVRAIAERLTPGWVYRAEYLAKPKHNTLCYKRVPLNYLMLFDINDGIESYLSPEAKLDEAGRIGIECVPCYKVDRLGVADVREYLERESVLGGQKIEGVVLKNYRRFGIDGHVLMGKFVSELFKETHAGEWKTRNPGAQDIVTMLGEQLRTPARWAKAVQRLAEDGTLDNSPRDIGALMKSVPVDVRAECEAEIRDKLFAWAWPQIQRLLTRGLPEWYKERLLEQQFNGSDK